MLYTTTYVHAENDYHREQLRRSYRPLMTLRAMQELTRSRTKRNRSDDVA